MSLTAEQLREASEKPSAFARLFLTMHLWGFQAEFADCTARYRTVAAGRQCGKSFTLAVIALWFAITKPNKRVILVSAGETASLRLIAECKNMALRSSLLSGSIIDDAKTKIMFSNGSQIEAVPASEAQIRGGSFDLLIVDEAGFVPNNIWTAAEPSVVARPGSRVIATSSPWGSITSWFRRLWQEGMDKPSEKLRSFHWPSSYSPLISDDDLADIQARTPSHEFAREYLAIFDSDNGAYFTTEELTKAVAPYELLAPEDARRELVAGGIDWGFAHDANAVVLLAALSDVELNEARVGLNQPVFYIAHLEARYQMLYSDFIDRLDHIADKYQVVRYVSELNGPGAMPSQVLRDRMIRSYDADRPLAAVSMVTTDNRRKANGFGRIKVLLQQGRLVLPNNPDLLRQLHALEFEQTITGLLRISVPEMGGQHDDLAMALLQAVSAINPFAPVYDQMLSGRGELLTTPGGTRIHTRPRALQDPMVFASNANKI